MRLLGVDPGTKRCGVALTNREASMAFPRPAVASDDHLIGTLRRLVEDEGVELVVVGRPLALSGHETASTKGADELYARLKDELAPLPVVQWDERLTTHQAQRSLSAAGLRARDQRAHVDSAAAVIMLENYAESHREN
ncbi:MAG TPA: Holliday junction resolvase RuvX [Acidimicrobiales bacterium]|nr:Holliday junction resolvase RuvX [Acidimicrobiales bacterium]